MQHILSILRQDGLDCLPCYRLNLDIDKFSEYRDSDEHPAERPFERPVLSTGTKKAIPPIGRRIPTILRYFLDGSRLTYKVSDILLEGRYLPLVAGQIAVAVVRRIGDGCSVAPVREFCRFQNVIAFPSLLGEGDLEYWQAKINRPGVPSFLLLRYEVKRDRDPVDLGIARIMKHMQDMEVDLVAELSDRKYLQNDSLLVVDGPLRFKEMRGRRFDIVQFRNAIGLSKTFQPSFTVGKGRSRADVGSLACALDFAERTSVFRTVDDDRVIGMWYLRIRPPAMMTNPLQGVVKIECYAIDPNDKENGLDADRIDIISGHVLRERNVTPYGGDWRWASHIYPIYLAEKYIKSSFMSDTRFLAYF